MTQRVTIGEATLYCGDALEILPTLAGVICCVSDPPYRLTSGGRPMHKHGRMQGGIFNEALYNNDGEIVPCDIEWTDWPPVLFAALAENADAYIMANDKNLHLAINAMLAAGFRLHNVCVWDKKSATANSWYMKNCEFAAYFWKGRARPINDQGCKQLISLANSKASKHPTEKPVPLMESYIANSTQIGDVVLDMFMGSGTTGVAALQLQRRFVGIERDPRYFEMACKRIEGAKAQGRLFGEMPRHQAALDLHDSDVANSTTQGGEAWAY